MTPRQELIETLTKYLNDPTFEISSISLQVKDKILYLNLDKNVCDLTGKEFDGTLIEDVPICGDGVELKSILESMRTEEKSEK